MTKDTENKLENNLGLYIGPEYKNEVLIQKNMIR